MEFISITSFRNREVGITAYKEFLGSFPIFLVEDMGFLKLKKFPESLIYFFSVKSLDGAMLTVIDLI
jgi:hypothetical protein